MRSGSRFVGWALLSCLSLAACEKKEESTSSVEKDAGVEAGVALDPELENAMKTMKATKGTGAALAPQKEGGPPPNGIFEPGVADKEAAKGSLPSIELGSEGSDPKISLSPGLQPGAKVAGTIQVTVQQGQQGGGLPIEFALEISAQKPKDGEAGAAKVTARVAGAKVPVTGVGKDVESAIGKLKGSRVEYVVMPDGAGTNYKIDVPKGVPTDLATWLESLRDTLALVTLPVPNKPLGTGAYWMVKSREGQLGLDLVTYRLVKVEAIRDGNATLSVATKRYSAGPNLDLPGLPPDVPKQMSEFQAMSDSRLEYRAGIGFPVGGNVSSALAIGLGAAQQAAPGQPAQQQGIMMQTRALLSFGEPGSAGAKPAAPPQGASPPAPIQPAQ